MRTYINFEQEETKTLLSRYDFEFFLVQNIDKEKYKQENVDTIYSNYKLSIEKINSRAKFNKKQFNYYAESQVRKMFNGGFLQSIFELDDSREFLILDFPSVGENWAYFSYWQKYQKRKTTKKKIWNTIIKTGSVLAIILSLIKFYEYIKPLL